MRRCTYCGKEYDDTATSVCVVDRQPVVQVMPAPEDYEEQSGPSVEFIRLFFKSPSEEEFAVRCARFLARVVGNRITQLRPDTRWSEIVEWVGPSFFHAAALAAALQKEFGANTKEILTNPEFTTFRDFVEYACSRERKTA